MSLEQRGVEPRRRCWCSLGSSSHAYDHHGVDCRCCPPSCVAPPSDERSAYTEAVIQEMIRQEQLLKPHLYPKG